MQTLIGQRFGRLTVLGKGGLTPAHKQRWTCRCDCGATTAAPTTGGLHSGNTQSCGCLMMESSSANGKKRRTHGMKNTPEWHAWFSMRQRCNNSKTLGFYNYGGRGISVCPEWNASFVKFYQDMGPRPSDGHSLDRIDTNGNYEPGNCRWATWEEQQNNTRHNVRLTFGDETLTASQWAARTGMSPFTIYARVERGWPPERILTTEPRTILSARTHCCNGHLLTPDNIHWNGREHRCRICQREATKRYLARKAGGTHAASDSP